MPDEMMRRISSLSLVAGLALFTASCTSSPGQAGHQTTKTTSSTGTTTKPSPKPTIVVDMRATPTGWIPLDYRLAQLQSPRTGMLPMVAVISALRTPRVCSLSDPRLVHPYAAGGR